MTGVATITTSDRRVEAVARWRAAFAARSAAGEPAWLAARRVGALERFAATGFPTTREEDWKFTDVSPIERAALVPAPRPTEQPSGDDLATLRLDGPEAARLVFVNGHFAPSLSAMGTFAGCFVTTLETALREDPARLETELGSVAPIEAGAFLSLNDAFFADGVVVRVGRGVQVPQPIHLVFAVTGNSPLATFPRNLIVLEEGAEARIVETYAGPEDSMYAQFPVTEAIVGANAGLTHDKLQLDGRKAFHVGVIGARQARASRFGSLSVSVGAAIARHDIATSLAEEGAECSLDGLYLVTARQLVDHHTNIDHATPHGTSREFYKGVLDGRSRAVFNGKIVVRPDAQKTDAQQQNRNLVLSNDAAVNSKPQLEIFANDVKCAHGATVGQIDRDALHYLRARGIERDLARGLLTYAFAAQILDRIADEGVRGRVRRVITALLPGGERLAEAH